MGRLEIRKINEKFAPKADLVFILDIDAWSGLDRIKNRKNKERLFEREDYLAKVNQIFRSLKGKNFIHLDALETEEEISQKIEKIALDFLRNYLV